METSEWSPPPRAAPSNADLGQRGEVGEGGKSWGGGLGLHAAYVRIFTDDNDDHTTCTTIEP
jgi:hypothetical protein